MPDPNQTTLCDCERGHNGFGMAGRECDCQEDGVQQTTSPEYSMRLCGDCSFGPPCRCSSDPSMVKRVWSNGKWDWVAVCIPEARQ